MCVRVYTENAKAVCVIFREDNTCSFLYQRAHVEFSDFAWGIVYIFSFVRC